MNSFGTSYEINRAFRTSKNAFMETSGEVSVFYYEIMKSNQACQFYLLFKLKVKQSQQRFIPVPFGNTESHKPGNALCNVCAKSEWVESIKHFKPSSI
jgi:hypothetical protein